MKDCLFCQIVKGEVPCHKIYEDDFVLAFLDIKNDIYGHTLVIPKKHYQDVSTCDGATLAKVIDACKKIGNHYVENCGFDGYNILNATGEAAQQSVFHLHFHVYPRKFDDKEDAFPKFSGNSVPLEKVCKNLKMKPKKKIALNDSRHIVLYTDGACSGNPGPGGWAAILSFKGEERVICGGEKETTNNRMELSAVINGLEETEEGQKIKVYTDSAYIVNAFLQDWIGTWIKRKWKNSDGAPVSNIDLWKQLLDLKSKRNVEFIKVKGHDVDEYNNRCDALARGEIAKFKEEIENEESKK